MIPLLLNEYRFRHTFVRILLQHGVSTADVAELIGDTEEMVRIHYARWVPERQQRLTRVLQEALSAKGRAAETGGDCREQEAKLK